ncbi:MAG: hypothetical protein IJA32_06575 [Lachnospiraceae bacterium]|nr:hypothetical protein [Lachnospiraceae bacterium]
MLIPAAVKKVEIQERMKEYFYSTDMLYENGCMDNWIPEISDCPDASTFQYAIVNSNKDLLGYFTYKIDWYSSRAHCFGIISFDRGNPIIGKDLFEEMDKLINQYKLHRIEWSMVGGNPIEKHYDKFCKKYDGNKHILKDAFKDRLGNYHDDIIYEIINDSKKSEEIGMASLEKKNIVRNTICNICGSCLNCERCRFFNKMREDCGIRDKNGNIPCDMKWNMDSAIL